MVTAFIVGSVGVFLPFACMTMFMYVQRKKDYRRIVGAPWLTISALHRLPELPEWVVLEARTGAETVVAQLSATTCAWYRVTVGRTRSTVESGTEVVFKVLYTGGSHDSGVRLVDAVDSDMAVWLGGDLAARSLGYGIPELTTRTVDERIGAKRRWGADPLQAWPVKELESDGWRHLWRLRDEGHLSNGDVALSRYKREGLEVVEETALADTPVVVYGRPTRQLNGIVLSSWGAGLGGVTTWSETQVRRRIAAKFTEIRLALLGSLIVLTCGVTVGWIAIHG